MTIEVMPLGMRCNLHCHYCYQEPARELEGEVAYDMEAMKAALAREGYAFTVFGGEPLLLPLDDLEELFRFGLETFGAAAQGDGRHANSIQTNGTLVTDAHVELFRTYDVAVGFSIDGPGELNDERAAHSGGVEATRRMTERSERALLKLLDAGVPVGLIVTLHAGNARGERLDRLVEWLRDLHEHGLQSVNLHLLEVDTPRGEELRLSPLEASRALLRIWRQTGLSVSPITHMLSRLADTDDPVDCIWNACDPYTTDAVRAVGPHGERLNCGRTYKAGVSYEKAGGAGYERYLALYYTPQEYGGCQGCRFWTACRGRCPGEGERGDWRGRTEHCATLLHVFRALEEHLVEHGCTPISLDRIRRDQLERRLVQEWTGRAAPACAGAHGDTPHGDEHADHTDAPPQHGDAPHGDVPHGDSHGDHTDTGAR